MLPEVFTGRGEGRNENGQKRLPISMKIQALAASVHSRFLPQNLPYCLYVKLGVHLTFYLYISFFTFSFSTFSPSLSKCLSSCVSCLWTRGKERKMAVKSTNMETEEMFSAVTYAQALSSLWNSAHFLKNPFIFSKCGCFEYIYHCM